MKAWCYRHPNLMVVWWSLLVVVVWGFVADSIDDHRWWLAALNGIIAVMWMFRVEKWYDRTDRGSS